MGIGQNEATDLSVTVTGCLSSTQENKCSYFNQIPFQESKHCDIIFLQYAFLCMNGLVTEPTWAFRSAPFMICSCVLHRTRFYLPPSHVLGLQIQMYLCTSGVPTPVLLLVGDYGPYTENTSTYSLFNCSPPLQKLMEML